VVEDGGRPRLPQETPSGFAVPGALRPDQLECYVALEHAVAGPVHDAHATRGDLTEDVEM
jgi:hypothetical protein